MRFFESLSKAVKMILIINLIVFVIQNLVPSSNYFLMLFPYGSEDFNYLQYITACFSHGGLLHIFFNMFALASFGPILERKYGTERFVKFYLTVGILANILWHVLASPTVPALGASGAIFGILTWYVIKYPDTKLSIIFLPMFPFKASKIFLAIIAYEIIGALFLDMGVGHVVHLLGAGLGLLYYIIFIKVGFKPKKKLFTK